MSAKKYTVESIAPRLHEFLRPLLKRAGFALDYDVAETEPVHPEFESPEVTVQFKGADVDLLLANRAELLLALEQVTMEAMRLPSEDHSRISFDANDYRLLRIEELRLSASAAAEKVKRTGAPFFFNPMNSRERRVIHLALRMVVSSGRHCNALSPGGGVSGRDAQRAAATPASSASASGARRRQGPGQAPQSRPKATGPRREEMKTDFGCRMSDLGWVPSSI